MKTYKNKKLILLVALTFVVSSIYVGFSKDAGTDAFATSFCISEKCKAAEAAEAEAVEKANNAAAAANTLEAEVERLNQQIALYEARIAANEATKEDLIVQIEANTAKLELQQQALANMLVNLHFEGEMDTIMILASSNSISDFAERQSRADTVKNQVNLSAQTVKSIKQDLEAQKAEVERIIADQELQKAGVQETKAQQAALVAKYRDNAAAYTAEAEAARREKEQEIANEIARLNSSGIKGSGTNTYPYAGNCPQDNLGYTVWGGYVCQCVSYTGWKVYESFGIVISGWGNAYSWDDNARAQGYRVDTEPAPGTVAVSNAGAWGHVMWVESVNSNGTINLSEYNNYGSSASGLPGDYGYRIGVSTAGLYFIHFR